MGPAWGETYGWGRKGKKFQQSNNKHKRRNNLVIRSKMRE